MTRFDYLYGNLNGSQNWSAIAYNLGGLRLMKEITMEPVIAGLRFIAENRDLSTEDLIAGLKGLGCDWTFDDWYAQFDSEVLISDGMQRGDLGSGACIIVNIIDGGSSMRSYCDGLFLSVDGDMSVYQFVRLVTGDNSFTKANIEHKKRS